MSTEKFSSEPLTTPAPGPLGMSNTNYASQSEETRVIVGKAWSNTRQNPTRSMPTYLACFQSALKSLQLLNTAIYEDRLWLKLLMSLKKLGSHTLGRLLTKEQSNIQKLSPTSEDRWWLTRCWVQTHQEPLLLKPTLPRGLNQSVPQRSVLVSNIHCKNGLKNLGTST